MTIYQTLLSRGYFPKELPPAFFTEGFAAYASSTEGRQTLDARAATSTDCVAFRLARPGVIGRELGIPHPSSFAALAWITAKNLPRLLKKAAASPFSKSRPVYNPSAERAFLPSFRPKNLARERMVSRAGGAYLVKADISHFYASLYTHAVGWAVDPKLRSKANWQNRRLLGKQLDQALMNLQGKVSQGVPIGNDISYLLAEIVLGKVDRALRFTAYRAYRWFDDYEISCDSQDEAEKILAILSRELRKYRLRLNPRKTRIAALPGPAQLQWQQELFLASKAPLERLDVVVSFFDVAFRLREENPDAAVLNYALGLLFKLPRPEEQVAKVLQSAITQALLSEPGVAQKAFALMSYWHLNGLTLDQALLTRTIAAVLQRHEARGVTSDVSWALAFCLEHRIELSRVAGQLLSKCDDDCIALQALHCHAEGLLPRGFSSGRIRRLVRNVNLDGEHWLLGYEALRQGFLTESQAAVDSHPLFNDFLQRRVTFYRTQLPAYAAVVHPGGAPPWILSLWLDLVRGTEPRPGQLEAAQQQQAYRVVAEGVRELAGPPMSLADTMAALLARDLERGLVDEADEYITTGLATDL